MHSSSGTLLGESWTDDSAPVTSSSFDAIIATQTQSVTTVNYCKQWPTVLIVIYKFVANANI